MTQISNNVARLSPAEAHEAVSIAQEVAQAVGRNPSTPAGKRQTMRLAEGITAASELSPLERKRQDAAERMRLAVQGFPNEKVRACEGCSRPTLGSFGPSGMLWRTVCQTCKDEADKAMERSCAALGKVSQWTTDTIMDRVRRDLAAADAATKHECKPVTGGPTNDATTDTLPLTSIGPSGIGGEYQSEVRP